MTYIDPHGKALGHLDRLAGWRAGETPAPVTIEWDLSNRCTLGCQSCHFAHTHTRGPWVTKDRVLPMLHDKGGDLADTNLVYRALGEAKDAGVKGIVWTGGGEPTTHPDWYRIVGEAYRLGLEQGMYTLGGLLTPATGQILADAATWVVVSLDCKDEASYAAEKGVPASRFQAACDGIRYLTCGTATVGVSFLLHEGNWGDSWSMLELARKLGATYATFRPTIRTSQTAPSTPTGERGWVAKAMPVLRALAHQPDVECSPGRFQEWADWTAHGYSACYGIQLNTTITPDGRMWVCPNRREFAGSCLGDLRLESFADIWARHPGRFTVDRDCRAMCRLHPVNQTLAGVYAERKHEAFI